MAPNRVSKNWSDEQIAFIVDQPLHIPSKAVAALYNAQFDGASINDKSVQYIHREYKRYRSSNTLSTAERAIAHPGQSLTQAAVAEAAESYRQSSHNEDNGITGSIRPDRAGPSLVAQPYGTDSSKPVDEDCRDLLQARAEIGRYGAHGKPNEGPRISLEELAVLLEHDEPQVLEPIPDDRTTQDQIARRFMEWFYP